MWLCVGGRLWGVWLGEHLHVEGVAALVGGRGLGNPEGGRGEAQLRGGVLLVARVRVAQLLLLPLLLCPVAGVRGLGRSNASNVVFALAGRVVGAATVADAFLFPSGKKMRICEYCDRGKIRNCISMIRHKINDDQTQAS